MGGQKNQWKNTVKNVMHGQWEKSVKEEGSYGLYIIIIQSLSIKYLTKTVSNLT